MAIEKGFPCNSSILEIEEGGVLIQEGCLFNIMAYGLVLIQGIALITAWVPIRGNAVFVQAKLQGFKNGTFFSSFNTDSPSSQMSLRKYAKNLTLRNGRNIRSFRKINGCTFNLKKN